MRISIRTGSSPTTFTYASKSNLAILDPPTVELWSRHRATPGQLFPLFPNLAGSSENGNDKIPNREYTSTNPCPQPTQVPPPQRNSAPRNAQQDTRGPRFYAHVFVFGMDRTGRTILIQTPFSAMFNQFDLVIPQPHARIPQPAQLPDQLGENHDQPRQPGDPGQPAPFAECNRSSSSVFATHSFRPTATVSCQWPSDGRGPEPGHGAPVGRVASYYVRREPTKEREDSQHAKNSSETWRVSQWVRRSG